MLRQTAYGSITLICSLFFFCPAPVRANVVEQVIVVIDGEPYSLSDLKGYAKSHVGREFPNGDLTRIGKEDQEVLEQFITERLLAAEAKRLGIRVSEQDIDDYIARLKERNRISDEELGMALRREGVTMEKYRSSVRAEIEKGEIINNQVRNRVNITSEDVERYYRLNPKRHTTGEKVRLRHILLTLPEGSPPEREKELVAKALEIRKRVMAGEDFSKLAQMYSEGAGASEGGDIGWTGRGSLLKEIDEVSFNKLSVGEISQPIRTGLGVHLIKLEGRDGGRLLPLSEVAAKIKDELYAKASEERFQKWLKADLRKRHRVDVKLPGVIFRPEEAAEGTVNSLMAAASKNKRKEQAGFLSYLNPLSYIVKETPVEGEHAEGELSGRKIVSVFGVPLFVSQSADDGLEDLPIQSGARESSAEKAAESGGFFSSMWKALNPFSNSP